MKTKEEHLRFIETRCESRMNEAHGALFELICDDYAEALAERDEAREKIAELEQAAAWAKQHHCPPPLGNPTREEAMDRIVELERELKNAREKFTRIAQRFIPMASEAECADMTSERLVDFVDSCAAANSIKARALDTAKEELAKVEKELKNAREAHGIAEQKVDEMLHPKPPVSAEVEGPYLAAEERHQIYHQLDKPYVYVYQWEKRDEIVRLLNLGVKSEGMQAENAQAWAMLTGRDAQEARDGISLLSVCTQVNARRDALETLEIAARRERDNETFAKEKHKLRADAAEAREKALRELVVRWRKIVISSSYAEVVLDHILAGHDPEETGTLWPSPKPADQAPEVTKP